MKEDGGDGGGHGGDGGNENVNDDVDVWYHYYQDQFEVFHDQSLM